MDELTPAEERYFATRGTVAPGDAEPENEAGESPVQPGAGEQTAIEGEAAAGGEETAKPEGQREPRRVPLAELLSERERRRAAEGELAANRARLTAIESQLSALAAGDGDLPDGAKDPEGYAKAFAALAERTKTALDNLRTAVEAQARQSEIGERCMGIYRDHAEDFAKRQPDYPAAREYLKSDRDGELAALGYADPTMRAQMLANDEAMIVARALLDGINPAERIYAAARRRGYKPGGGDGEKLRLAERGQAAGKSLGSASGGATPALSAEALAALDDTEFAQATKGEKWKRLWE